MKCLDKFNKRMSLSGGTLRNEYIFNTKQLLNEIFSDDPSLTLGIYFWRLGLKEYQNETPINIRLYDRKFSAANGVTVKFQTLYNTPVVVGDVIYDANKDEYLICTEAFDIDGINYEGKFTLCNWMLKWQNKHGRILEYPCYDMNSTQYNSGEQSNRNFTIESSQHMLTLPCDENTVELSTPQRFYLDKAKINPTTYIVTQNDTTSYNYGKKGLVKVTVFASPHNFNSNRPDRPDRPDLGICDYIDMSAGSNDAGTTVKETCCRASKAVIEYDTSVIKSGGDLQVFIGKFYDENENEVTDIEPHWTIDCDFRDKLIWKEIDNKLSIGIDDDAYIDERFKITCSDNNKESNIIPSTLVVKVESLL
ncbi:MAG: hypothetical protein J6R59_10815 [Paludibacteraceae bacterium]|nr:hypothetical protein [Paludibacteraceae bacterium]